MITPDGFFVINQPKHKIPGIFDLNDRGMFKTRPYITKDWGYRIVTMTSM